MKFYLYLSGKIGLLLRKKVSGFNCIQNLIRIEVKDDGGRGVL